MTAEDDIALLAKPVTFHFSGKVAQNGTLKSAMTERLCAWSDPALSEENGKPTPEYLRLYEKWGEAQLGVFFRFCWVSIAHVYQRQASACSGTWPLTAEIQKQKRTPSSTRRRHGTRLKHSDLSSRPRNGMALWQLYSSLTAGVKHLIPLPTYPFRAVICNARQPPEW
jgi:hypothetical protein